ncbi:unnamed protein product [Didymodactylos carnosus]|uniref:Exostosin GT47 domain-containing protein n=1 Tax=Didymodactylos carnosus TaxID=1234261 RepID=A0A813UAV2_9BILA|nr:unnamed protein product [Didymodactylos carnosus]CAF1308309.1 unnamed protein product [Didymodactylos carnosus]CAF3610638.1 unnamed protein product [Didymodactylos carnosus]CAF4115623.1 unnamed protein product [Didymodactylos carnosus]
MKQSSEYDDHVLNYNLSSSVSNGTPVWNWLINDSTKEAVHLFYKNSIKGRNTSYPYFSGDTARSFADLVFDETTDILGWRRSIQKMSAGAIVFLKTDYMKEFFTLFDKIKVPFVLITHNSDKSAPGIYKTFLSNTKLLAWFSQNPDTIHPKLHPMPIGISNNRWMSKNINVIALSFNKYRRPFADRQNLLYVNFKPLTNRDARIKVLEYAKKIPNAHIVKRAPLSKYLEDLGNSKFVLSPSGNGIDCHRTWEALLMGAVPIIMKSTLDPLFKNIPAIVIQSWTEVTEKYLLSFNFNHFDNTTASILFAKYWYLRLLSFTNRTYPLEPRLTIVD